MIDDTYYQLNDAFPNAFTGDGIFSEMLTPPWGSKFTGTDLDLMFFSEHGQKIISPLVEHFTPTDGTGMLEANRLKIASLLQSRFYDNWTQKFKILNIQYDLQKNYDITETETIGKTDSENVTNTLENTAVTDQSNTVNRGTDTNANNTTGMLIRKG